VVEDSEDDTFFLMQELRRNGYEPNHQRVETAEGMRTAIEQHSWDVVVSDYTMPRFSGFEALELFNGLKLDIPFIFVSGTSGEEAAVRMMKAGADDYIVKSGLSRLVPAIEREMESARTRQARIRAEATANHLAAIVESSRDAIYSTNLNSIIVSWNPAAENIYGYGAKEIIGRSIAALFPHTRRNELLESMTQIRQGELTGLVETERLHKSGRTIPVSVSTSPIKNADDEITGASVIERDISKQKQEEQERVQLISELSQSLSQVKTLTGKLSTCVFCKCIRDDSGAWLQFETYITSKSSAVFSHGICPECSVNHLKIC
jgi:PAS domain S-box-containing protein